MADIFVSYARADKARVAPLVAALEAKGWSVWWDPAIIPGQEFDDRIAEEIDRASAVVVVWTPSSVASRWVRGEAREAADRGILVPVRFENARLPIDVRSLHTTELDGWDESTESAEFKALLSALEGLLRSSSSTGVAKTGDAAVSIAVLPFVNMSSDPEQEYFSDGLSEELMNQLTQLKQLRVTGRTSSFAFKGRNEDLRVIGQKLGVAHILEGSVRKAGKRVRITAQLIKCDAGHHLWSHTYDRELDDIFAIQDDISREVAAALKIALGFDRVPQIPGGTRNAEAYDLYLRALSQAQIGSGADAIRRGLALFRRAVAIDPEFAAAWLYRANSAGVLRNFGSAEGEALEREQAEGLERAIALAPDLWAGHAARGSLFYFRRDWIHSEEAFSKAEALAPNTFSSATQFIGLRSAMGRVADTVPRLQAMRRSDPLLPIPTFIIMLTVAGRYAEAEAEYVRIKESTAGQTPLPDWFALSQAMVTLDHAALKQRFAAYVENDQGPAELWSKLLLTFDDRPAAVELLKTTLQNPARAVQDRAMLIAYWLAYFGVTDTPTEIFRRTFLTPQGTPVPLMNIWHPVFAAGRKHPAFKDFVREIGIYDYWRKTGKWGDFARPLGADDFEIIK
ncbi:MAG: TIR domain-containing protein [Alphaproteobacteria bacterium]